jgi:hypothetical protein
MTIESMRVDLLYKIKVKNQASLEKVMPDFWLSRRLQISFCGDCKIGFYA